MIKRISAFFLSAWLALAFGSAGLNSNQQAGFGVTALNGFNAFGCRADFFLGAAILGSGESVSMSGYQGKIKLGGSLGTGKTLMIPRGCNRMNIKAWGAGGTGGGADTSGGVSDGGNGGNGGGGGYAAGSYPVIPGIIVSMVNAAPASIGASSGTTGGGGGDGGGGSGVEGFNVANEYLVAGGGGGGGGGGDAAVGNHGGIGGVGGGTNGGAGATGIGTGAPASGGGGATGATGGTAGPAGTSGTAGVAGGTGTATVSAEGGNACTAAGTGGGPNGLDAGGSGANASSGRGGGGGGGGGRGGGGGGGCSSTTNDSGAAGGGGGSNGVAYTGLTNTVNLQAVLQTPPRANDPDYCSQAVPTGQGSAGIVTTGSSTVGGRGCLVAWLGDNVNLPPNNAFIGCTADASATSSPVTFTSHALGEAHPDRTIIVGVASRDSAADFNHTSMTIGGISATEISDSANVSSNVQSAIYIARVPSGSTGNIVVNLSEAITSVNVCVWAAYDIASLTAVAQTSVFDTDSGVIGSLSINTTANGIVVGVCSMDTNTPANWALWTAGLDEMADAQNTEGSYTAADSAAGGAPLTIGMTGSGTSDVACSIASFD